MGTGPQGPVAHLPGVSTAFVYLRHDNFALTLAGVAVVIVVARIAGALVTIFVVRPSLARYRNRPLDRLS